MADDAWTVYLCAAAITNTVVGVWMLLTEKKKGLGVWMLTMSSLAIPMTIFMFL